MSGSTTKSSAGVIDWKNGLLSGPNVRHKTKTLGEMEGIFHDSSAFASMDPNTVIYRVQWIDTAAADESGLLWGNTTIEPGRVGDEFFMTYGHFHAKSDRCEFYATISGSGRLVLMSREGHSWTEDMCAGSLHYIHGDTAHRVVNVGDDPLTFVACWPSDAGHDYESIAKHGFSLRVVAGQGKSVTKEAPSSK